APRGAVERSEESLRQFGGAWIAGAVDGTHGLYVPGAHVDLPTYAFDRRRHWYRATASSAGEQPARAHEAAVPAARAASPALREAAAARQRDRVQALLIQEVLQVTGRTGGVDVTAGFFDLGLDSLMAVELRNRIERALDVKLPTTVAFDYSSIEELAEYLCRERGTERPRPAANGRVPALPVANPAFDAERELEEIERLLAADDRS
ncbi:MAG TPA: acyl carrier protein, partial [Gemmatimonadaceae bacterium]|nr:acyl carrier protein [Gemmatimonadaceae bacterium]